MFLEDFKVIENIKISDNYYLMRAQGDKIPKHAKAGQFFMLETRDSSMVLRRPISLHNVEDNILEFYYEALGKGTKELARMKEDEIINIQGPLGTGLM